MALPATVTIDQCQRIQLSSCVLQLVSNLVCGDAPELETKEYGPVPMLDVSASSDAGNGQGAIFLVNRSQTDSVIADFIWQVRRASRADKAWQLAGSYPKEVNSWQNPERVIAKAISVPTGDDDRATLTLPPLSLLY